MDSPTLLEQRAPEIVLEHTFVESAFELPKEIAKKVFRCIFFFSRNRWHPGLHFEELSGCAANLQSIRVDDLYRVIMRCRESLVRLLFVGPHDVAYRFAQTYEEFGSIEERSAPRQPFRTTADVMRLVALDRCPAAFGLTRRIEYDSDFPAVKLANVLLKTVKYLPLARYLLSISADTHTAELSFKAIEDIIARRLPWSAKHYRAWWANHIGRHVQAEAWLLTGWEVDAVDLHTRCVVFRRSPDTQECFPGDPLR